MSIQSARSIGGTGSILVVLGAIGVILNIIEYAFFSLDTPLGFSLANGLVGLLNLLGWILFLVAMHTFSKHYSDRRMFDYILYGIIATIVAGVIAMMALVVLALGSAALHSPTDLLSSMSPSALIFGFVALIYLGFAVTALKILGAKTQVPLFNTAVKVFLAGAVVQIVMGIAFVAWASANSVSLAQYSLVAAPGGLIQYVGWFILSKAFFSITPSPTPMPATVSSTVYPATSTVTGQTKYCVYCGAANSADMVYCIKCGKKQ